MRTKRFLLIAAACALLLLPLSTSRAQDQVTVTLETITLAPGNSGSINAMIDCPLEGGCSGFAIEIRFDPAVVGVDDALVGPYLGEESFRAERLIDNDSGVVRLAAVALGAQPDYGEPVLLTLDLTARAEGVAPLTIFELQIADVTGNPADARGVAGAVVVSDAAAPVPGPTETVPADQDVWDDPNRVTVLLLGIDQREGETGPFRTDTIILLSLDPVGKTGAILSIPRDLWVEYPGLQQQGKINGANLQGDAINYPGGGGPAFAAKAVEEELGVRIPYYVLIDFEVFYTFIDAIGPIEVCPTEVIHDDKYPDDSYGYMTVHFDPGCQELDSERLLQYVRVRHSDSDIARSTRQLEVILAVRQKVLTTGGVAALISQAPDLWNAVKDNIRTNLTFEEMRKLAAFAEEIPSENIRQDQISFEDVELGTSPLGDEILIPIRSDIREKVANLFRPPDAP